MTSLVHPRAGLTPDSSVSVSTASSAARVQPSVFNECHASSTCCFFLCKTHCTHRYSLLPPANKIRVPASEPIEQHCSWQSTHNCQRCSSIHLTKSVFHKWKVIPIQKPAKLLLLGLLFHKAPVSGYLSLNSAAEKFFGSCSSTTSPGSGFTLLPVPFLRVFCA